MSTADKTIWDISNHPSTKTKLEILSQIFDVWLTVWNKQSWAGDEWYILDLFAGRGKYSDGDKEALGSPLIFLKGIHDKIDRFTKKVRFKLILVEKDPSTFDHLRRNVDTFFNDNPTLRDWVEPLIYNEDCNTVTPKILSQIQNTGKNPLFALIDPTGLQINKDTVENIVGLNNPKDIIFNYILEGVRRTSGVARKANSGQIPTERAIKTIETLKRFIGNDINIINQKELEILEDYVASIFTSRNLKIVAYDLPYPDRADILYYLIFASRNLAITNIIKDIFAREKEKKLGATIFGGKEYYKKEILTMTPKLLKIQRKSLLYKTKVEYGSWTINHIVGCMHGCKFPCYAMVMAKKFGWVKGYNDWRVPRIAENALEILEREIIKYRKSLDFVHLCFMSDPFMYNSERQDLIPEVRDLSLKIIEKLNNEGIRVTTLTKGIYPDELMDVRFLKDNEYGITLVSLDDEFKKAFEPYSSPYSNRIEALKKLHEGGLKTWVSIEPYPTPNLDKTAEGIERLLEKISFVDKIIFGRLNYNVASKKYINNEDFYKRMSNKVIDFCKINKIKYHIKSGTPYSNYQTKAIFRS